MHTRKLGKPSSGQGLVEYALLLGLVAVVAIVAIGLVSVAVQRNYGIVGAVLGAKKEQPGVLSFIYFPRCGHIPGQGTGLYAEIITNVPMSDLTVSTDTGFITMLTPMAGGYKIQPNFTQYQDINDLSLCPHGLVVQTSQAYGGATALYPVMIQSW